jgi:MtrB/PioB family decaheme-associated outer membrane protein
MKNKTYDWLLAVGLFGTCCWPASAAAESEEQKAIEPEGYVEAGIGYQTDDAPWFGRYSGLTDRGGFFIGDLDLSFRPEPGAEARVTGHRLGLDSRSLQLDYGRQGRYGLSLWYDQLPNFMSDTAVTPYEVPGDSVITVSGNGPEDWIYRDIDLETKRKQLGGAVSFLPTEHWKLNLALRREHKEGLGQIGGSIGFIPGRSAVAVLPMPIDYTTHLLDASAGYAKGKGQFEVAYHLSRFRNDDPSLTWENPFPDEEGPGPEGRGIAGRQALAPDNDFHRFTLSGGYQLPYNTRFMGVASTAIATQDESFLPYTVDPNIPSETLPRSSLDGDVRLYNVLLKLASAPFPKWRFNGSYRFNDRDNRTPQATYTPVVADSVPDDEGGAVGEDRDFIVTNNPYSYRQHQFKLDGNYRLAKRTLVSLGYDFENMDRDHSEVDRTDDHRVWGKLKWKPTDRLDGWLKLGHSMRDGSGYHPAVNAQGDFKENPLMRKFNLADRDRDELGVWLTYAATQRLSFTASGDYARDDYDDSVIGLTKAKNQSYSLEASFTPRDNVTTYAWYSWSLIEADQVGREADPAETGSLLQRYGPDWSAQTKDRMHNLGVGVQWQRLLPKVDMGADYVYSKGTGETDVDALLANPFPDNSTKQHSLRIYAQYRYRPDLSFKLSYWHEKYDSSNWALDGVEPVSDDYPLTLFMGEESPDYDTDLVSLTVRYSF